jgi:hypothetical protein
VLNLPKIKSDIGWQYFSSTKARSAEDRDPQTIAVLPARSMTSVAESKGLVKPPCKKLPPASLKGQDLGQVYYFFHPVIEGHDIPLF